MTDSGRRSLRALEAADMDDRPAVLPRDGAHRQFQLGRERRSELGQGRVAAAAEKVAKPVAHRYSPHTRTAGVSRHNVADFHELRLLSHLDPVDAQVAIRRKDQSLRDDVPRRRSAPSSAASTAERP